jgi:hypothetical protein
MSRELKDVDSGAGTLPPGSSVPDNVSMFPVTTKSSIPDFAQLQEKIKKSEDVGNVAKFMMVGMLCGAVYGWTKRHIDTKNDEIQLEPKAHYFGIEPNLSRFFDQLSRYRAANETDYSESIRDADRILMIEKQISDSKTASAPQLMMAKEYYRAARMRLFQFRDSILNGTDQAKAKVIVQQIADILQAHLTRIHRLTAPTRSLYALSETI